MKKLYILTFIFLLQLSVSNMRALDWLETTGPNSGFSMCFEYAGSDEIFAGTYGRGIFVSKDNGNSWIKPSADLDSYIIYSVVRDIKSNLWAGTNTGLFFSSDNGKTWKKNSEFDSKIWVIKALGNGSVLISSYKLVDDKAVPATFVSADNGKTWTESLLPGKESFMLLSAVEISDGTIVGSGKSIYKSSDGGKNFSRQLDFYSEGLTKYHNNIYSFYYSYNTNYSGILYSTDESKNWKNNVFTDLQYKLISAAAIDSTGALYLGLTSIGCVSDFCPSDECMVIKLSSVGAKPEILFREADNSIKDMFINKAGDIFVASYRGAYRKLSGSDKWEKIINGMGLMSSTAIKSDSRGNLYCALSEGSISKSSDGGAEWKDLGYPSLGYHKVTSLLIDPDDNIYAATSNRGMLKSTDGGIQWETIVADLSNIISLIYQNGYIFYSAFVPDDKNPYKYELYRSSDKGMTWDEIKYDTNPDNSNQFTLTLAAEGQSIYAFESYNLFDTLSKLIVSKDNGETWNTILTTNNPKDVISLFALPDGSLITSGKYSGSYIIKNTDSEFKSLSETGGPINITSITKTINNKIFASTGTEGCFSYNPETMKWENAGSGVENRNLSGITYNRKDGRLYVSSLNSEVLKSSETVDEPDNISLENNLLVNIYPNPSRGNLTVTLEDMVGMVLEINIFDIYSRRVYNSNINNTSSNKKLVLNIDEIIPGVYFLELITNKNKFVKKICIIK